MIQINADTQIEDLQDAGYKFKDGTGAYPISLILIKLDDHFTAAFDQWLEHEWEHIFENRNEFGFGSLEEIDNGEK